MKRYFWDWYDSLDIEQVVMEYEPFHSVSYSESQGCFTSLEAAKREAKRDLKKRIADTKAELELLESSLTRIEMIDAKTVTKKDYIQGL
jgi:hypothetical protein